MSTDENIEALANIWLLGRVTSCVVLPSVVDMLHAESWQPAAVLVGEQQESQPAAGM